jgi:hypothetical protein
MRATTVPLVGLALLGVAYFFGRSNTKSNASVSNVAVHCDITPQPPRLGPATIALTITDTAARQALSAARVQLEADMAHPGMSPVFSDATEIGPGRYQGRIDFSMAGDWVLLVHVTLANGQGLERQFDVKGVRAS